MIWTVLDYPRNVDVELNDLPDAIRPLDEVTSVIVTQRDLATNATCYQIKSNIQTAVDKGWFKVTVFTNDGAGGHMVSQAEVRTALGHTQCSHSLYSAARFSEGAGGQKWRLRAQEWLHLRLVHKLYSKVFYKLQYFNISIFIMQCMSGVYVVHCSCAGSMAALGIMMLLLTVGGVLALLVLVLKW